MPYSIRPGLFDLHAHYNLDLVDKGRVEEVVHNGIIYLANGVTACRMIAVRVREIPLFLDDY
ncbi:MAG: hypothetical protein COA74_11940 [Gammaproteobacteria bacterium]|nr:MAG: hypothetical protein COA74_11940 [Gammaproteobacteria bacterium]